eukprot:scaffold11842_cov151-Amphora_coffeaeformis.AAC.6
MELKCHLNSVEPGSANMCSRTQSGSPIASGYAPKIERMTPTPFLALIAAWKGKAASGQADTNNSISFAFKASCPSLASSSTEGYSSRNLVSTWLNPRDSLSRHSSILVIWSRRSQSSRRATE